MTREHSQCVTCTLGRQGSFLDRCLLFNVFNFFPVIFITIIDVKNLTGREHEQHEQLALRQWCYQ